MTFRRPPTNAEIAQQAFELINAGKRRQAQRLLKDVLRNDPDQFDALQAMAVICALEQNYAETARLLRRALRKSPDFVPALVNLGTAFLMLGQALDAEPVLARAAELEPRNAAVQELLGQSLQGQGKLMEAAEAFVRAADLAPGKGELLMRAVAMKQKACNWSGLGRLEGLMREGIEHRGTAERAVEPFVLLHAFDDPVLHRKNAELFWKGIVERQGLQRVKRRSHAPRRRQRIKLGYLSADFHQHATAFLMAELFELHDRTKFEVFGFSYGPDDGSPIRKRLISSFDRFVDVAGLDDDKFAERIAKAEIDIVVDLKGHTENARLGVLARRPAPVQCHYLGYPGTIGGDALDYIIVDKVIAPQGEESHYTEKLVRLPHSYQVNDRARGAAAHTPSRADVGLPDQGVVFASFNGQQKLSRHMLDVWARVLAAVPGSALWVFCDTDIAGDNLRREIAARGVASDRLVTAGKIAPAEHLARLPLADLMLDTLPYGAHTTASDALWMGLPVLTCLGQAFAGRVCASLVAGSGLPELVVEDMPAYEAKAIALGKAPHDLARIKQQLVEGGRSSALFDTDRFRRDIEAAYQAIWERWLRGEPPDHISL